MGMKILKSVLTVTLLLALVVPIAAKEVDLTKMPGYVDLSRITVPDGAEDIVDIDIDGEMLQMVASDSGGNLQQALADLKSVRVKSFDMNEKVTDEMRPIIEKMRKQLEKDDWDQMIYVKNDDESFTVSVKKDKDKGKMVGLMVIAFEPEDSVTFVNIIGNLNFKSLAALIDEFGDGEFEELLESLDET
jgi:hypothetical protein